LLKNAKDRGVVIIPVILRHCLFEDTYFKYPDPICGPHQLPLSVLQSANPRTKPLNAMAEPEQDEVLLAVARRLLKLAGDIPVSTEHSTPSHCTISGQFIGNIPRRNPFFTGREDVIQELRAALFSEQTVVLSGLGGTGKTETAAEFVYQYGKTYEWVFWIAAESRETLIAGLTGMAAALNIPGMDARDQMEIVGRILRWLDTHHGWLLVFDNADNLLITAAFLPGSRNGHVLLTSRAHATGYLGPCIRLETLVPEQGALLVLRRGKLLKSRTNLDTAPEAARQDAMRLSQILGGLPLALDQAGAFLEETHSSPADYLHLYHTERARLLAQRGELVAKHPSVFVTFVLAYETTVESHPAAAILLHLCAFLAPDDVPEDVFTEGGTLVDAPLSTVVQQPLEFANLFKELGRLSLIHRDSERRVFGIHRLVQAVIQDMMDNETQRHWAEKAAALIHGSFPAANVDSWARCEQLVPHALACVTAIERWDIKTQEAAHLLNQVGYYLNARARYVEAEPLYQHALAIRERVLGPEHPDTARILNNLASLYQRQGRYLEAEPLYQRALAIRERVLGPEHPDTATSLNDVAVLYHRQGKFAEAELLYKRALAIREHACGSGHSETATSLNDLAGLYESRGQYVQAEPLYQRALTIRERVLGPDHPDTAESLNDLAVLCDVQGKYGEAEPLYQRALAIMENVMGPEHPHTAASLNNLAFFYNSQGRYAQAEPLYQRALVIMERVLGSDHPDTATGLNNLAMLYQRQGKYREAEPLCQRAIMIMERVLGSDHPNTAHSINNLAGIYESQGKYVNAELLYQRAVTTMERVLGPDHPDTATSLNDLASLYESQGKHAEAEPLYRRALTIREPVLGPDHPDTAATLNNLAGLLHRQSKWADAEQLYQRALAIRERVLGPEHPDTARTLNDLASLYESQGQYARAELLYQRALTIRDRFLGPDHPHTALTVNNLANLYRALGDLKKADELGERYKKTRGIRSNIQ
jgi:tetratricopeptide (TPR) repeat protein